MGFSSHVRGLSPGGGRHHHAGPRASTAMVQLGSSLDPYEAPRSRHDYDDYYYPSDVGYTSTYRQYPGHRASIDVQPLSTQKYRDPGHSTKKRTEYAIQPQTRHRSHTASATDIYDAPGRLAVPSSSSSHLRPVVSSGRGHRSPSPLPIDSSRIAVPSSSSRHGSGHRRVYSTDYASDTGRLEMRDPSRHRTGVHHGAYRVHPPAGQRRHPPYDGPKKGYNIDNYDAYSYTCPGEEARRDLSGDYPVVRPRHPSGRTSIDRPMSVNLAEEHPQWLARSKDHRHHGPPPTSWGLDRIDRGGRPRSSARGFDDYRDTSRTSAIVGHDRALVALPHESDDDYHSDTHRRSHRDDVRRHVDDRSPRLHNGVGDRALAIAGLGTAALGGFSDASDLEHHRPGRRRHRRREAEREYDSAQPSSRDLAESGPSNSGRSKQLYLEPSDALRRRRHSRRRSSRRSGSDTDVYTDDEDLHKYRREPAAAPHRSRHSSTDTSSADDHLGRRPPRDRSHHRSRSRRPTEDARSTDSRSSPFLDQREEVRKPITVEPPATKEPEQPAPKSILKPPKKAFPEEPNPIREGVAPLKDANKNGVPPTARWTKIDRRLVNPAALEAGNERYEERPEFVIVLRVLTKEEIQAYALKTQELRHARREEYVRDKRQRREEDQRHGRRGAESSSDDEDESSDEPLKIEAPPVPDANTSLPMRSRPASDSPPLPERPSAVQV